jgi:hypothetical protein
MTIAADGIKRLEQRAALFAKTRLGLAACCVVAAFVLGRCTVGGGSTAAANDIAAAASVLGAYRPYEIARQATIVHERAAVDTSARSATHAAASFDSSTFYKRLADSLTAIAGNAIDTSAVTWEGIAAVRSAEATTARHAADSLRAALTDMTIAKWRADDRAAIDSARVVVLTAALTRTADDLAHADPPCRVLLGLVHCQSRKQVAGEAAIGGALAVKYGPDVVKFLAHLLKP